MKQRLSFILDTDEDAGNLLERLQTMLATELPGYFDDLRFDRNYAEEVNQSACVEEAPVERYALTRKARELIEAFNPGPDITAPPLVPEFCECGHDHFAHDGLQGHGYCKASNGSVRCDCGKFTWSGMGRSTSVSS